MRRWQALFAVGLALSASACASRESAAPPNIVLIYVDDLGWRDLGVQGSRYYETPHVDRLAAEGMRFTNAYANAPNCAPSRAALLSGQYAPRTGVYTVRSAARGDEADRALVPVDNRTELALEVVTIAEALRDAGYATGHAGKWHLGGEGYLPADQGFTWSVGGDAKGYPPSHFYPYRGRKRSLPGLEEGSPGEYLADRLTDEAIGFIEEHASRPFFLYLSHYSVHTPIQAKPELIDRYRAKPADSGQGNPVYAAMVHSVDEGVGRLLAAIDRLELRDNTVVIFYSDNGGYGQVTSMEPLRGSKGMMYEGGIREPLIVRWPGTVRPGSLTEELVIGTDFFPTLLEIAGASAPADQPLDGVSLLPAFRGSTLPERDLFWHFPAYLDAGASSADPWRTTPVSAIRRDNFKLLHFFEESRWELYDLDADISEERELSAQHPERTAELRSALEAWWESTGAYLPVPATDARR